MNKVTNANQKVDIIKLPKIFLLITTPIVIFLLYEIYSIVLTHEDRYDWTLVVILSIILALTLYLTLLCINWKVEVFETRFIYQTIFRRKYEFNFEEVVVVKYLSSIELFIVEANGKKLFVNSDIYGIEKLIEKLKVKEK